jgi:hypothetical protein
LKKLLLEKEKWEQQRVAMAKQIDNDNIALRNLTETLQNSLNTSEDTDRKHNSQLESLNEQM